MENNFSNNLKHLRIQNNMTQEELGKKLGKDYSTIGKWENGSRSPIMEDVIKISQIFDVSLEKLIGDLFIYNDDDKYKNDDFKDINLDVIKIPILGVIKAGIPIEAQENIIGYTDIPKDWTKGNKKFFGLKISGNSMTPNYLDGDTVIFESTNEFNNGDDCAVMINGDDCTFKKVAKTDEGILLQPYNIGEYDLKFYSKDDIAKLPVKIIGVAREYRRKI